MDKFFSFLSLLMLTVFGINPCFSQENTDTTIARFTPDENGRVIVDNQNHLMWQQSGSGFLLIGDGVHVYVDSLNRAGYAGFNDWRLPSLAEAITLIAPTENHRTLHVHPIFDNEQAWIFTSDIDEKAWPYVVYFTTGMVSSEPLSYFGSFVRLVRDTKTIDYPSLSQAK